MILRIGHFYVLLGFLLAGCGSSPETHFHTLVAVPPATSPDATVSGPKLQVGRVGLPSALDRLSMVTMGPGTQVNVSDQDRWVAPLNELVRRALTLDLRARLGDSRVLAPGDTAPDNARIVALNIQEFSAGASGTLVLDTDWTLGGQSGRNPHTEHTRLEVKATSPGPDDMAGAMSRALGQLADRIAAAAGASEHRTTASR
jgi:uncharacterized lipoprotein YmbA